METLESIKAKLESAGYTKIFEDCDRYCQYHKAFNNSETPVAPDEELQIGRSIEIHNGYLTISAYLKRGSLWSGQASPPKHIFASKYSARIQAFTPSYTNKKQPLFSVF